MNALALTWFLVITCCNLSPSFLNPIVIPVKDEASCRVAADSFSSKFYKRCINGLTGQVLYISHN